MLVVASSSSVTMPMRQVVAKPPGLKPFSFCVHATADKFISERIRKTGTWEPFESRLLLNLLGDTDQVIDVGANIGWYTVSAARRMTEGSHVFSFEPDATNFALLTENVRKSGLTTVSIESVALGRCSGSATIQHSTDNQGDHRVRSFVEIDTSVRSEGDVRVVALDDYLSASKIFRLDKLRIIKIDVQGFENEVLMGARRLLLSLSPRTIVFIEFDPQLLADSSATACQELVETLLSLRREIFAISRPIWRLRRLSAKDLLGASRSGTGRCFDLVIVHPSSLQDVRRALPAIPRLLSQITASG